MPNPTPSSRSRRGAYSVSDVARMCGISRSRFYDLIRDGVMPQPVYCLQTRRPLYPAELAALCQRVRETNTAIDGRFVLFYERRQQTPSGHAGSTSRRTPRPAPVDPLTQEMIDTLRAMGVRQTTPEITAAIAAQCPGGISDQSFEAELRAVFDSLRGADRA